jgi:hypothetical protein
MLKGVKENPRVTRERLAARAERRLRDADNAAKEAIAKAAAQQEIRARMAAEIKARFGH